MVPNQSAIHIVSAPNTAPLHGAKRPCGHDVYDVHPIPGKVRWGS
ncbi:MAG: hypothetical protein WCC12_11155 [Anaerolineales bacterium]